MKYASVIVLATLVSAVADLPGAAKSEKTAVPQHVRRLFRALDKNSDGAIKSGEARGAVSKSFGRIDADSDGRITLKELHSAIAARSRRARSSSSSGSGFRRPQAKHRTSRPVPTPWLGYGNDKAPEIRGATYLKAPEEIRAMEARLPRRSKDPLSYPKSTGLRIVATGHSWMWPGYRTLPTIAKAAGLRQHMRINGRGGELGGIRMMWELENGILSSRGKPSPVCMSAITTGKWDAMIWGCYTNDRPEYYFAWIEFCLKFNPKMKFYVFNAWPQWADGFGDGDREPKIENYRARAAKMKKTSAKLIADINKRHPGKVRILPTREAMMAALELYFQGKLPGVKALNRRAEGKSPAIWSDGGHLGVGMDRLEGYVFYATLYKKSPELIKAKLKFHNDKLDGIFRKIAWRAVVGNPLSGVADKNNNGIGDSLESNSAGKW